MRTRLSLLAGLAAATVSPALAQTPAADAPPSVLYIYREEVKPGKGGAHEANETNWAAAAQKANLQDSWVGMTSMTGPSEAWFLSGYASLGEWESAFKASDANEMYSADSKKLSAVDGDLLARTSGILARYRAGLSYKAGSNLAPYRYLQVQIVRVKQGYGGAFAENWREVVAAHQKAEMDEGWAMYQVTFGMPDTTYLYLQPYASLADFDKAGPMHAAEAYRNAVGESGRARSLEMTREAVEWSQSLLFAFNPKMSSPPKAWLEADAFWKPTPVVKK